jgi:hypothetical protein
MAAHAGCGYRGYTKEELTTRCGPYPPFQQMRNGAAKICGRYPAVRRFEGMIRAMSVSKSLIEEEIEKRG